MYEEASMRCEIKWKSISMSNNFHKIKTFMRKSNVKVIGSGREITIKGKLDSEKNPLKKEAKSGIY